MRKIAAKTLRVYITVIRFIHVDQFLSIKIFTDLTLRRALNKTTSLNSQSYNIAYKQLIFRETLKKIVTEDSIIPTIMRDFVFCLVFADYFRIDKLIYTKR